MLLAAPLSALAVECGSLFPAQDPSPEVKAARERFQGIAQAFLIAESFIGKDAVTLILGDNIFWGGDAFHKAFGEFKSGATIFGYHVNDPERYGVAEVAPDGDGIRTVIASCQYVVGEPSVAVPLLAV